MNNDLELPVVYKRQRTETEVSDNLTTLGNCLFSAKLEQSEIFQKAGPNSVGKGCSDSSSSSIENTVIIDRGCNGYLSKLPQWGSSSSCSRDDRISKNQAIAEVGAATKQVNRVPIGSLLDDCLENVCGFLQTLDIARLGMCNSVCRKFVQDRPYLFSDLYFNTCCSNCSGHTCSSSLSSAYPATTNEMLGHFISKSSGAKSVQVIEADERRRCIRPTCPSCESSYSSSCRCLSSSSSRSRKHSLDIDDLFYPEDPSSTIDLSHLDLISICRPSQLSCCLLTSLFSATLTNLTRLELVINYDINLMINLLVKLDPIPRLHVLAYSYVNQLNLDDDDDDDGLLLPTCSSSSARLIAYHFPYLVRLRLSHYIITEAVVGELLNPILLSVDDDDDDDDVLVILPLMKCIEVDLSDNEGLTGHFLLSSSSSSSTLMSLMHRPWERLILRDCTELRSDVMSRFGEWLLDDDDDDKKACLKLIDTSSIYSDGNDVLCGAELKNRLKEELGIEWIEDTGQI